MDSCPPSRGISMATFYRYIRAAKQFLKVTSLRFSSSTHVDQRQHRRERCWFEASQRCHLFRRHHSSSKSPFQGADEQINSISVSSSFRSQSFFRISKMTWPPTTDSTVSSCVAEQSVARCFSPSVVFPIPS